MWTRNMSKGSSSKNSGGCGTSVILFFVALTTFSAFLSIFTAILYIVIGIAILLLTIWLLIKAIPIIHKKIMQPFTNWILYRLKISDTNISDNDDIEETDPETQNNISESIPETHSYDREIDQIKTVEDECFLEENQPSTSNNRKYNINKPKRRRSEEEILRYAIMCNANIEHQEEMDQYENTEEKNSDISE